MAHWLLGSRVDVGRITRHSMGWYRPDCSKSQAEYKEHCEKAANTMLRAISKLDLRPSSARYEDCVDQCVEMSFIIDAESLSETQGRKCRIHDSLSKAIDDVAGSCAIEFDPPREVETGAKIP